MAGLLADGRVQLGGDEKIKRVLLMTHLRSLIIFEGAKPGFIVPFLMERVSVPVLYTFARILRENIDPGKTLLLQAPVNIHRRTRNLE